MFTDLDAFSCVATAGPFHRCIVRYTTIKCYHSVTPQDDDARSRYRMLSGMGSAFVLVNAKTALV